jgi:hypothetical protein
LCQANFLIFDKNIYSRLNFNNSLCFRRGSLFFWNFFSGKEFAAWMLKVISRL